MDHPLRRNIEIKARCGDIERARRVAIQIATHRLGVQWQVDTYFACPHGRLKLRQIRAADDSGADTETAELIWYVRPDQPHAKASDYRLVPVSDPKGLAAALSAALGTTAVVRKRREIFLYRNVRIHLDEVEGLGTFVEFEAVLEVPMATSARPVPIADAAATIAADNRGAAAGAADTSLLDYLAEQFSIAGEDLLEGLYGDLLRDFALSGFRDPLSCTPVVPAQRPG
jgi:adenylate cyclase class IV